MVIAVFPFEFHSLWNKVLAYLVVDIGLVGLAELVAALHAVYLAVFDEMGACLVEAERDAAFDTLLTEGEHPVVVAGSRLHALLSTHGHLLYRLVEVCGEVDD